MEDRQPDAWYYSHETQRTGPVTFHELQTKAKAGSLNPRLDLVWMQGMSDWTKAGEVDGLFERRMTPGDQEAFSVSADPYLPPEHESAVDAMQKEGGWPGCRRRGYLVATLIFPFLWMFILTFATPFLAKQMDPELLGTVMMAAGFLPALVGVYFVLGRFANLGMSRWWFFGNFVPILNVWLGFRCFACPAGYAYHKKMDGPGIFLAIIYWLMIAVLVLGVVAFIVIYMGMAGGPDLQKTFQDAIREAATQAPKP